MEESQGTEGTQGETEQGVTPQVGDTVLFNRKAKGGEGYIARKGRVAEIGSGTKGAEVRVTESAEDEGVWVHEGFVIPLYRMVPQPPPMVKTALQNSRVLRNVEKYLD